MIAPSTIVGGRYRVVRTVGGGGMKLVYLAEDLRLAARPCALAEMIDGITNPAAQRDAIAAFQREADMLAQLSNEHIPRVIDRFSEANHHYLVMEFIDGQTLEDQLKTNGGKLAPDYVIDVALQILETLEYLHSLAQPVIYRDLKPSNVMISADGRVKLIDFGIARFFAPLSNATMIGTQGYAPPEQYRGKVEARSDLYALGATMHHALSGRDPAAEPPFSFPPLGKVAPEIDSDLAAIVDQALAYDVVRRIPDAGEFRRRLSDLRNPSRGAAASQRSAKPSTNAQLPLPLGTDSSRPDDALARLGGTATPAATPPVSSAPTVVTANPEIRCPGCARTIPADSRFCSYCAARLRGTAGAISAPNDATVLLSPTRMQDAEAELQLERPRRPRLRTLRRGTRRSAFLIVLIFFGGFAVMKQIAKSMSDAVAPAGYDGGSAEPAAPIAPNPGGVAPFANLRLTALRQALDAQGYGSVQFQTEGDTLVLSGTIGSEEARAMVYEDCNIAGFFSLRDNLRVADADDAG